MPRKYRNTQNLDNTVHELSMKQVQENIVKFVLQTLLVIALITIILPLPTSIIHEYGHGSACMITGRNFKTSFHGETQFLEGKQSQPKAFTTHCTYRNSAKRKKYKNQSLTTRKWNDIFVAAAGIGIETILGVILYLIPRYGKTFSGLVLTTIGVKLEAGSYATDFSIIFSDLQHFPIYNISTIRHMMNTSWISHFQIVLGLIFLVIGFRLIIKGGIFFNYFFNDK